MVKIRNWERFKFNVDYQNHQANPIFKLQFGFCEFELNALHIDAQQKEILKRSIPENLKLAIAKKIENNLFSKVFITELIVSAVSF
jgi:hypothetical protein